MGTCAVFGGIQSLRVGEDLESVKSRIYPIPEAVDVSKQVKPVHSIIRVDFSLPGCPVSGRDLESFLRKFLYHGLPVVLRESVCMECKRRGIPCLMVSENTPCLGLVVNTGCSGLCPSFNRGCYGCFGLKDVDLNPINLANLLEVLEEKGLEKKDATQLLRGYGFAEYSKYLAKRG